MSIKAAVVAVSLVIPSAAQTKDRVVISCGDATGFSHFLGGGIIPDTSKGWREDSISPGQTLLISDEKGKVVDIRQNNAGGWMSYTGDGCSVAQLQAGKPSLFVVAICPGSIDSYMFAFDADDRITMLLTQIKSLPLIRKAMALKANCRAGQ